MVKLRITEEDLTRMQKKRMISPYRNYASWYQDFAGETPSYQDGILTFEFVANRQGKESGTVTVIRKIIPVSHRLLPVFAI